jgi:hypothetical protein
MPPILSIPTVNFTTAPDRFKSPFSVNLLEKWWLGMNLSQIKIILWVNWVEIKFCRSIPN